jgi:membrane-associated phospholipid phosphatase
MNFLSIFDPFVGLNLVLVFLFTLIRVAVIPHLQVTHDFFFFEQDPQFSHPYFAKERVPNSLLYTLCFPVPIGIWFLCVGLSYWFFYTRFTGETNKLMFRKLFLYLLVAFALAGIMTVVFTDAIKLYIGEPRPHFFDHCNYQYFATNQTYYYLHTSTRQQGNANYCRSSNAGDITESLSSFPSGHASSAFCAATSIFFFFYHCQCRSILIWLSPFIVATYIAATRVLDNYHNLVDVTAGSIFGLVCALSVWSTFHRRIVAFSRQVFLLANPSTSAVGGSILATAVYHLCHDEESKIDKYTTELLSEQSNVLHDSLEMQMGQSRGSS